ncbi:MAG: response regulator transcription factor [Actinobacteria bacterium]|nr:response regulator transcription factor [Actinomycetota bacterium]
MRILVVDDEAHLSEVLKVGLMEQGYAVDVSGNGISGLELARTNNYDAIILDIMLPGMNGFRVCAALRAEDVWTPILMLTAKSGDYDHAEALDTGADDFLAKPFSFVVLVAHLRALIRRRGGRKRPAVLSAGDLRLDPASHRCFRGDVEVELTPRQFSLLEYLMRHTGDVCSKAEIIEHVWDQNFDGDPNIVEVYVGHLRRRIDVPFGRQSLRTVRGSGYRVDPDDG